MTYHVLGGETTKKLLERGSIYYTLTREHKEYMMAAIFSNLLGLNIMLVT